MAQKRLGWVIGVLAVVVSWCGVSLRASAATTVLRTLVYHQITAFTDSPYGAPLMNGAGTKIVFDLPPQGTGDPANPNRIFVMNTNGTGLQQVDSYQSLVFSQSSFDISDDGSKVVSTDSVQLRITNTAGNDGTPIIAFDSNEINDLCISGDGSKVFFRLYRDTSLRGSNPAVIFPNGVYVVNADGSNLHQIVSATQVAALFGTTADQAAFFGNNTGYASMHSSSDGSHLIFSGEISPQSGGVGQVLFGVNGDGSGLHSLTGRIGFIDHAGISGDGSKVGVTFMQLASNESELDVMNFDGSGRLKLTDNNDLHPNIGRNIFGPRVQFSKDGTKLFYGDTGLLFDTNGTGVVPLGINGAGFTSDPFPAVFDGLTGASISNDATRVTYLITPGNAPNQFATLDVNPATRGAAPALSDPDINPPFVLSNSRSAATVKVRASGTGTFLRVTNTPLLRLTADGDFRASVLFDDGTNGDAIAHDGIFTNSGVSTDCCAPVGPRTVRIKAESLAADGKRHATAIDVQPFAVVDRLPPPTITGFTPNQGPVGTSVVITGTNFIGATAVKFNGVNADSFHVDSLTQITAIVPSGQASGRIGVFTPWGAVASAGSFTVLQSPFITGRVVNAAGVGVASVHIVRTNPAAAPATAVTDADGHYSFSSVPAGTCTLTPALANTAFSPATRTATVSSSANATGMDFTARPVVTTFTISGVVSKGALPLASPGAFLAGAPVFLVNTASLPALAAAAANPALLSSLATVVKRTTTSATGAYSFTVTPGAYIVATGFPGIFFTPAYHAVNVVAASVPGQNFTGAGIDGTAPVVTVSTATATSVTGTATDSAAGSSGILTVFATLQDSSGRYFNFAGTGAAQFTTTPLVGSYKLVINPLNQTRVPSQNWSLLLPAVLPAGTYHLSVRALDRAFRASAIVTRTIVKAAHAQTALRSSVVASSAAASASTSSVRLQFSGALDAGTAADDSNYSVSVNGQSATVQAAGYDANTHSVALTLTSGALPAGATVVVAWDGLSDGGGALLGNGRVVVTAK